MKDVFDREKEVELLKGSLSSPLVVISGLRRTGKTSLVRSILNDAKATHLFLDMRRFENREYIVYKDFLGVLEREVNSLTKKWKGALDHFRAVKGVKVAGLSITFGWGRERTDFSDVLSSLNDWAKDNGETVTVVVDEAQELVKLKGYDVLPSMAYAFDNLRNVNFIVTGSEVRVKTRFLKLEDADSPLYGRAHVEVDVSPFDRETSVEFLERGFEEHGIEFDRGEEVYEELGGNPGWLTFYGYVYVKGLGVRAMEETKKYAKSLLSKELCNFLMEGGRLGSKERYLRVLEACRSGCSWKDVKNSLEALEGREVNDYTVHTILRNLLEYSFLVGEGDRRYFLADPLMRELGNVRCSGP
ncbi:ATPase [Sulfodiicoccus acidiphilus]|uniref:ATPase n=1 Tax=Sulfodiicoccus acidiphilus TaxID=1670455 RepID=A0A348B5K3_9CREN|nr:ATP-binding protein [Sulfodiicoccus acidiphilus]BBD73455.1 ATPase [Sulfodiicoccus acidiphilus]GGT92986.1 ATPase [Sulfodiicoccus acidiphilus]